MDSLPHPHPPLQAAPTTITATRRRSALLPPLVTLVLLAVLWQLAVPAADRPVVIPPPLAIIEAVQRTAPILANDMFYTAAATLIGLAISLVVGVGAAALLDLVPLLRQALYPLLVISQTVPLVGIAALLILIFGFEIWSKVAVVVLFCFFPIAVATLDGLQGTDPDLVALLRAMGANRQQIWRKVRFPAALPAFFSGLRIAATYSVTGAVTGEFITAPAGLGRYLRLAYSQSKYDQVFAAIALISLMSLLLVGCVALAERVALPWYFRQIHREEWNAPGIY
jgi:ABC-type nitrate/sulfonate/bicarbonate transport system permease component